jgi:hypothetical protein
VNVSSSAADQDQNWRLIYDEEELMEAVKRDKKEQMEVDE